MARGLPRLPASFTPFPPGGLMRDTLRPGSSQPLVSVSFPPLYGSRRNLPATGFCDEGSRLARGRDRLGSGDRLDRPRCPQALRAIDPVVSALGRHRSRAVSWRLQLGHADRRAAGVVPRHGLRLLRCASRNEGRLAATVWPARRGRRPPARHRCGDRHGSRPGPEHRGGDWRDPRPPAGWGGPPQEGRRRLRQRRYRPTRSRDV